MSGTEIDVHLEEKGIKMIVNPYADKNARKPNAIQTAFTEFFNDLNAMRDDFNKQSKKSGGFKQTCAAQTEYLTQTKYLNRRI